MNTRLSALGLALLLLPCTALAWTGNTWGNITRLTIKANADGMIDFTWTPKNTFTNFAYGSTYYTYTPGTTYSGVAYSQNNPQENLAEFLNSVTNTAGGSVGYGNDCSGFASICWKLTTREVTSTFESKLGGTAKWFSLGDIGTAATANLVMGDALNSDSVGHIVLFLNYDTSGVRTMEQTPRNAQRKIRSYSNVAEYRPIRRMAILEDRCVLLSGSLAFGNVVVGTSSQRTLTVKNTGTNVMTVTNLTLPSGFSGNWSGTIPASGSQNVTITFSPTALTTYSGTLKVNCDAYVGTNTLSISGSGMSQTPQILTQPQSQTVVAGQNATLAVTVSGVTPLSYQWRFNGANLAGATLSSFTRTSAQFTHSGNYDVVITNSYGAVTSRLALLEVGLTPLTQTLWLDNFDSNTAGNWQVNRSSTDCRATFNYDYSANGIPSAPNSSNGTTRGLKFEANVSQGVVAAINASPVGKSFGGDYRLRFDLWINQNGPFPAGGTGSTQHGTAGVGTAGNRVQWNGTGSTADGYWFAVDGEGQASDTSTTSLNDYMAFSGTSDYAATSGIYAAGTGSDSRGNLNTYYTAAFPGGQTAPAVQQTAYPQQTGGLAAGTIGFAWRDVIISKAGNTVDWSIGGVKIATLTGASLTSSNIFVGLWDSFASLSDNTNLSFAVFDNVRVERLITNVPPYLTRQAQDQAVTQGTNVTFSVVAGGTAPLSYQWCLNGQSITGATASSYSRSNVQTNDAGTYSVIVTNAVGTVSSSALLSVAYVPPPQPGHFEAVQQLSDGSLQFTMTGTPGTNYVLQCTSDFLTWSNVCTLCAGSSGFSWTDSNPTNRQCFYRLVLLP